MKQALYKVLSNEPLTASVYRMVLEGDTSAITAPGQFVNLKLDGMFLRRPISVCDYSDTTITLIYKTVGTGTEAMSELPVGTVLDVLTGLGNGYNTGKSGEKPLLIGGGVGVPPMYRLCKELIAEGKRPRVILGFNTAEEIFYFEEFKALFAEAGLLGEDADAANGPVYIATADGSVGVKGFVTDVMKNLKDYTYFFTCGPLPMFKAIERVAVTSGQYSFEERMGCGFGACMGCSCKTKYGNKRICKDGPVLEREEIIW
ncbi:MAG: dihydroorotate dehydrogenase electron transfer subunit [Lachnospiraceae bacterium]|nr:dihydroorotate dehydrogenase electron transfer subunit [Lachnospiraceae bacterium]